jgi:hypothetical protein
MLKYFIYPAFLLMCSCQSLMNPQEQSIVKLKDNVYKTTCSGTVENWGQCFNKAKRTCQTGYTDIERLADGSGVHRSFTFSCK